VPGKSFRIKRLYTQVTQYFDFKKYEKETMNQEVKYTQGYDPGSCCRKMANEISPMGSRKSEALGHISTF
jgi:hypothetical protein